MIADFWKRPPTIQRNNFIYKSLSCWSYNIAVGCAHSCRFCYTPEVSTIKMTPQLAPLGVTDPDAQWGEYLFVRTWKQTAFATSLKFAEATPLTALNKDGNRAVMFCTTTDPYQVVHHADNAKRRDLQIALADNVRNALRQILEDSTLNVRILTRSPLARLDFDLMKQFGNRLLFGMSLPCVDNKLARVYEPHAPSPSARLETLKAAKAAGIPIYVAMAPTYPEQTGSDLQTCLEAIAQLEPLTIFHEPINVRAENVARIADHARTIGVPLNLKTWTSKQTWAAYAVHQLQRVETIARVLGIGDRLHLWPDKELGKLRPDMVPWFSQYWNRISEWPK